MLHPEDQQDMPERHFTNLVKGLSGVNPFRRSCYPVGSSAQSVGGEDEGLTTETRKHGGEVA